MPRFEPFRGVLYNAEGGYVDDVIAPPYDVISPDDRARLAARSEHNAVRLELPAEERGADRYETAAILWREWREERVLVRDDDLAFYAYRMGFHDEAGRPRQTTGFLGALELSRPDEGQILPHEHTTPKAKTDRLELLRATGVNLSPIWGLSLAPGLSALAETHGQPPDVRATDDFGVHHRLWRLTAPAVVAQVSEAVASSPLVVADGHHRYEVALARRDEVGSGTGADFVFCYVVELADEQLSVRAIHRLLSGLPEGFDLVGALAEWFEPFETGAVDETITARMADAGALALVTPAGTWLLRPRPATVAAAGHDLDSSRLDVALAGLAPHDVVFQHGWDLCAAAVAKGEAQAAVLLRPATVAQIAAVGRGGDRMPPKTTFFYPKPATGLVFRPLDDEG